MEVSSINQNPIVNVAWSSFFNMQGTSFMINTVEDLVDMVMYCNYSVQPFFCDGGGVFIVVIEVYGACIKAIETSVGGEFVGSGSHGIIGKFCER